MPNISQINDIVTLPKLHEASPLHSQREPQSMGHLWKYVSATVEANNKHSRDISQLNREIKRINDRRKLGFDLFPFKIYVLPDIFRGNNQDNTNDTNWRTVRVRGGYVLTETVATSSFVHGCDGFQEYAYGNTYNVVTASADILLSNNSFYWFWIEQDSSSYNLRYATNPASSSTGNPNPWTAYPTADSEHIPIGYVDTQSSSSVHQACIRNLIDSDIVIKGGGTGTWAVYEESASYSKGTIVWVDPTKTYSVSFYDTGSGGPPPLTAGAFFVIRDVPASVSGSRPSGNYYYPFFPPIPDSSQVTVSGSIYNTNFFGAITPLFPGRNCVVGGITVVGFGVFIPTGSVFDHDLPYIP